MGDVATLITAIGGSLAAVLAPIVTLVIALRRVSPNERAAAVEEAASPDTSRDEEQDELIADLRRRLEELQGQRDPDHGGDA